MLFFRKTEWRYAIFLCIISYNFLWIYNSLELSQSKRKQKTQKDQKRYKCISKQMILTRRDDKGGNSST